MSYITNNSSLIIFSCASECIETHVNVQIWVIELYNYRTNTVTVTNMSYEQVNAMSKSLQFKMQLPLRKTAWQDTVTEVLIENTQRPYISLHPSADRRGPFSVCKLTENKRIIFYNSPLKSYFLIRGVRLGYTTALWVLFRETSAGGLLNPPDFCWGQPEQNWTCH